MALLLLPMDPRNDTSELPEEFQLAVQQTSCGRWVTCQVGQKEWRCFLAEWPAATPSAEIAVWNHGFSVAKVLDSFPEPLRNHPAATDPAAATHVSAIPAEASTKSFCEGAIQAIDKVLEIMSSTMARSQGRTRRRTLDQVRKEFVSLKLRCGPDGGEAVWNAVGLSITQFLSEKVEAGGEEWWSSAEKYFTEWNQIWVAGLAPGLQNPSISTRHSLDLLRCILRRRLQKTVEQHQVLGIHSGTLTAAKDSLKLYVPRGQMEAAAYQVQSFSHHLVWVAQKADAEVAVLQGQSIWEVGQVFLVRSTSHDLTRLTLLPKATAVLGGKEEVKVIAVLSQNIHDYIFTYNCFWEAWKGCEETVSVDGHVKSWHGPTHHDHVELSAMDGAWYKQSQPFCRGCPDASRIIHCTK